MSIYLDTCHLNSSLKKVWTIMKQLAGDNINQPWNWSCRGEVLSTKIKWKNSKKIQEFHRLLRENLGDVEKYMKLDKNGILLFKVEKINSIPKLNMVMYKAINEWIKSAEENLTKSNKVI